MVLPKDPDSVIDYAFDWSDQLEEAETILSNAWTVEPIEDGGMVVDSTAMDGNRCTAIFSGGVVGNQYRATNQVVTSLGRTYDRSLTFLCFER